MTLGMRIEDRANIAGYLPAIEWDHITALMDDDIRERVHSAVAPCSHVEFWHAYCVEDGGELASLTAW